MNKVAILTDGKAGHENQSRAFARGLRMDYSIFPVRFKSSAAKALSYPLSRAGTFAPALFSGWDALVGEVRSTGPYQAVIGTGSGTFHAVRSLARTLGVPSGVVLYPRGYRLASFDCILAPSFDNPARVGNVVEIPANLVASDAEFYASGVAAFRERHTFQTGHAAAAVIVGGPNKCAAMPASWIREQLDRIFAAHPEGTEFWVTTSRRTPPDVEAVVDTYPWAYKLIYSRDRFNPIPAFVSLAQTLYVTAESTGMISEACTFGSAEVRVLDNLNPGPSKFRRFVEGLSRDGYVGGARKIDLSETFTAARRLMRLQ